LASSAQFIPYVDDTYHAPGYVGGEHRLVVELTAQDATVSAAVEITKKGSGAVQAQDATTSATTKRTVNALEADLHDGPSVVVDVAGDGERSVVTVVAAAEVDTPSQVTGVAERIINASGALSIGESSVSGAGARTSNNILSSVQAQSSTVSGTSNAQRNASGAVQAQDATIVGVAERTINASGTLAAQSSVVTGIAEREIDDQGGNALQQSSASIVSGVAERVITSSGSLESQPIGGVVGSGNIGYNTSSALQTQSSVVTGEAENIITGTGVLQQSSVPVVSGVAERIITGSAAIQAEGLTAFGVANRIIVDVDATPQTQSSSVTGLAENSIVSQSAALQTQSSTTVGVAERIIVQEGAAQFKPTDNNVVTGQGVRKKNASGALQQSSASIVTGVAERIITPDDANLTASEVGVSVVTGISEREVVQTGDGSLEAQSSTIVGVAKRIIVQEGAAAFKPTDNNVAVGVAERVITGSGDLHDGPVVLTDVAGDAERQVNTTFAAIVHDDDAEIVATANVGRITSAALSTNSSTVAAVVEITSNQLGDAEFQPSANNLVVGLAERVVTAGSTVLQVSEVITGPVSGVAEREIVTESGSIQAQPSVVTGLAENKIVSQSAALQAQSSTTVCAAERIITQEGGGALKPTNNNTVTGLAEVKKTGFGHLGAVGWGVGGNATRIVVDTDATPAAQSSTIAGVGVRTSNTLDGALTAAEIGVSVVAGNGERSIVTESAAAVVDDQSDVVGVAEREITGTGTVGHRFTPETVVHTVTNNGSASWKIDGQTNPTLEFHRGSTYIFSVTASGHPFWIKSSPGTGTGGAYNDGVTNNGDDVGTITFVVPDNAPSTLYYNCQYHGSMGGTITVLPALSNQLQNSVVTGAAERELLAGNVAIVADDCVITSTVEITSNSQGQLSAQDAVVVGLSERTIVDVDTTVVAQDAVVSGAAEREIRTSATLVPTANNIVAGIAEREIRSAVTLSAQNVVVSGVAERIITGVDTNLTAAEVGISAVVGNAERKVVVAEGNLTAAEIGASGVAGVAEREIETNNITQALAASDVTISGVAERIIDAGSLTIRPTEYNVVYAVAERTIVALDANLTASEVGLSVVVGDAEREVITEQSALIVDDPSDVAGSAERIVTGSGERITHMVSRSGNSAWVIDGVQNPTLEFHKGSKYIIKVSTPGHPFWIKSVPGTSFPIGTGTENAYNDGVTNNGEDNGTIVFDVPLNAPDNLYYNCQYHPNMAGTIDVQKIVSPIAQPSDVSGVAEREIRSAVTLEAPASTVNATTNVIIKPRGILECTPSLVEGTAKRTVVDVVPNPAAQSSTIAGVAERIVELEVEGAIDGDVNTDPSTVAGVAERIIRPVVTLSSEDSQVSGVAERKVVSVSTAVAAQDVTVVCSAERIITSVEADLTASEVGVSVVAGVAEREIDDQGGDALTTVDCLVTGVAERIIKVADGVPDSNGVAIPRSGPSTVNAVTKRTVFVIEADLTADEVGVSNVVGTGARREVSAAVPLVRSFRITKPKQVTIVIRTKPSAIEAV